MLAPYCVIMFALRRFSACSADRLLLGLEILTDRPPRTLEAIGRDATSLSFSGVLL